MSKLAREALMAREASLSYGKWKALQPMEEPKKKREPGMSICPECGKAFKKRSPKQIYCESYCQHKGSLRRYRERKEDG